MHVIVLAPSHQLLAAETGIGPKPDVDVRPAFSNLCNDPGDLLLGASRGVDVRGPKRRQKQLPAAKNVKRQIAVAFVIAVEEPAFLVAVDGIAGRVEIENDARGRRWMALEKDADEQPFHRALVHAELAIAVIVCLWRMFKPVQRRLSRQLRRDNQGERAASIRMRMCRG